MKLEDEDPDKRDLIQSPFKKKVQGIVPKDIEQKKEMMSFIAYPPNLEAACRLLSQNKSIQLQEGPTYNKNRIFVSGTSIWSTKLTVSLAQSRKLCRDLEFCDVHHQQVKKQSFLDKKERANATQKMKGLLAAVAELQQKYVELSEFKKNSCLTVNQAVPKLKITSNEHEEGLSEAKQE